MRSAKQLAAIVLYVLAVAGSTTALAVVAASSSGATPCRSGLTQTVLVEGTHSAHVLCVPAPAESPHRPAPPVLALDRPA